MAKRKDIQQENLSAVTENIVDADFASEMTESYRDYAIEVITDRALPSVRDGLKPVQRRVLFAMHELGIASSGPHKKCARIVGETMGKYHPHGDSSIYETLVRMAQSFSLQLPLVDGHGNFGSVDGDPAAAMRYTEARLSPFGEAMLADIKEQSVPFKKNFDESLEEPSFLPCAFPNLLVNGNSGIAVGMSTNIPPHNLGEIVGGVLAVLNTKDGEDKYLKGKWTSSDLDAILESVKGPDFPTECNVIVSGVREAYASGRGRVVMESPWTIEDDGKRKRLVFSKIPYQVIKTTILEEMGKVLEDIQPDGVLELRDESDKDGIRIVVEGYTRANMEGLASVLLEKTSLRTSFSMNLLALDEQGIPRQMNLPDMLYGFAKWRREVVRKRTEYRLDKAERRLHIVSGLLAAVDKLDAVIAVIRGSKTVPEACSGIMELLGIDKVQADAILDLKLQRLTGIERENLVKEAGALEKDIAYYKGILSSPVKLDTVVRKELEETGAKFAVPRRSPLLDEATAPVKKGVSLAAPVDVSWWTVSLEGGFVVKKVYKRKPADEGNVVYLPSTERFAFLTKKGDIFPLSPEDIPDRGRSVPDLTGEMQDGWLFPCGGDRDFLIFTVLSGKEIKAKRMAPADVCPKAKRGSRYSPSEENEVYLCGKDSTVTVFSSNGKAISFPVSELSEQGKTGWGVRVMKGEPGDFLAGVLVDPCGPVQIVFENGFYRQVDITKLSVTGRGGKGSFAVNLKPGLLKQTGPVTHVFCAEKLVCTGERGEEFVLDAASTPTGDPGVVTSKTIGNIGFIPASFRDEGVFRIDEAEPEEAGKRNEEPEAEGAAQDGEETENGEGAGS